MFLSVDFHCHTCASEDSLTPPASLVKTARQRKLGRLVVTDHNTIAGALEAKALDPELVIVGEEIMTTQGEILAAYVREEVPAGLTPQETIYRLREQGAFISVSHPFDALRSGAWKESDLAAITPLVDAIETFNARCMLAVYNRKAQAFARRHHLPGTAGSDAHARCELGAVRLVLPEFSNPDELRAAIKEGEVRGHLSPFRVHFYSRYAKLRKKAV
jgi:predicted metal-dependent phosphoesterase TrpH